MAMSGAGTVACTDPPLVSAIIVSYNTAGLLRKCLRSLVTAGDGLIDEIIVVDNASSDGSVQMVAAEVPSVRLRENRENVGFGRANNQAVALATGRYLLLLNSDAVLHTDAVATLPDCLPRDLRVG